MNPRLDPTQAIEESAATGEVADIFADIRETMNIPLVTSIWRCLAGLPGALPATWAAIRPLMVSTDIDALLEELAVGVELPMPLPLTAMDLADAGIASTDYAAILNVVAAYNRSNCLNLIAVTALLRGPTDREPRSFDAIPHRTWLPLPVLLPLEDLSPANCSLLQATTTIGAAKTNPHIPTLWRHLMDWPGLVNAVATRYNSPELHEPLIAAVGQVTTWVETHAPTISHCANHTIKIPAAAREMLTQYVGPQPSVARMCTVGMSAAQWLRAGDWA